MKTTLENFSFYLQTSLLNPIDYTTAQLISNFIPTSLNTFHASIPTQFTKHINFKIFIEILVYHSTYSICHYYMFPAQ